jgi:hypothetical protein
MVWFERFAHVCMFKTTEPFDNYDEIWWWGVWPLSAETFQVALSQNHIWEQEPEDVHFVWPSCWAGRHAAAKNMLHTRLCRPVLFVLLCGTHENMSHLCEAYRVWRLVRWKSRKVRKYVLKTVLNVGTGLLWSEGDTTSCMTEYQYHVIDI